MPDIAQAPAEKQAMRFLLLYAFASAGGAVAYVPFLTIILPSHVTAFAGANSLSLLAYITFAGAISASISNILFGWASDVTRTRRPWIIAGLILSCIVVMQVRELRDPYQLIAVIVLWQACLNMMLAPLAAWAGDCVPDAQKGLLGGLLALTPALGAMSGILITWDALVPVEQRLFWVAGLTAISVLPVLSLGRPRNIPALIANAEPPTLSPSEPPRSHYTAQRMWVARLLVQVAEASLFAFLLLWFRSIDPAFGENRIATIFTVVLCCAVIIALVVGRWSDRHERPLSPLIYSALGVALGLAIMAVANSMTTAIVGYALFGMAGSVFLAIHSSQTLRVLPNAQRRGRDLGIFNLTNTVPSMVMPWMTLALVPVYGFDALFIVLALLALGAAALLWRLAAPA